jgi:type IV secretory pathway VirB4 component
LGKCTRDRYSHMYPIGKTGTGKSTLIRALISQDIANGEGCALIDPHVDLVEQVYRKAIAKLERVLSPN